MSELGSNLSFDDLFAISRSFPSPGREHDSHELGYRKLQFGLELLEDHLLQLCLPYLESDENRILFYEAFIANIKDLAASVGAIMRERRGNATIEVWDDIQRRVAALDASAKPVNVLLMAIAVAIVRHFLENLEGYTYPLNIRCTRAHPGFHRKLREVCDSFSDRLLGDAPPDVELRNVRAALRALA